MPADTRQLKSRFTAEQALREELIADGHRGPLDWPKAPALSTVDMLTNVDLRRRMREAFEASD